MKPALANGCAWPVAPSPTPPWTNLCRAPKPKRLEPCNLGGGSHYLAQTEELERQPALARGILSYEFAAA